MQEQLQANTAEDLKALLTGKPKGPTRYATPKRSDKVTDSSHSATRYEIVPLTTAPTPTSEVAFRAQLPCGHTTSQLWTAQEDAFQTQLLCEQTRSLLSSPQEDVLRTHLCILHRRLTFATARPPLRPQDCPASWFRSLWTSMTTMKLTTSKRQEPKAPNHPARNVEAR